MNRLLLIGTITAMGTAASPTRAFVQTAAPAQSAAPAPELSDHPPTPARTRTDPQQYLGTAKQLLDAVPTKSLDGNGQTRLSHLREDFANLVTTYQTHAVTAPTSAASVAKGAKGPATDVVAWEMKFSDVERDLTLILGGGSSRSVSPTTAVKTTGHTDSTERPTGTDSSIAAPEIGVKHLDPDVRMQLEQVRTSVELFYDATGRTP